jgi:ubiquinone/menaquinone biosynthesis C-methylase UbiE
MSVPNLPFTGERFTPECVREIWYEHWHRYAFALQFSQGKRVLDAACGEGYGSALLATRAASVLGLDLSQTAIMHARARYAACAGLQFGSADCTRLDHLADATFDLIVSFETLEHVEQQERMLDGFARLLAPDGLLLVSTPDRRNYSDIPGVRNEHHVRELYRDQFERLVGERFPSFQIFAHKLLFQSVMWASPDTQSGCQTATLATDGRLIQGLEYPPMYYIAVCARRDGELPQLPSLSLFGDAEESVYSHYYGEVRRNMDAGHRIAELEQEIQVERQRRIEAEEALASRHD